MTSQIARETSSRGASSSTKRSPSGPCSVAPSPRIASVTRKPSRPGTPVTAVGWNCTNSRSAIAAPGALGEQQADAERPGRVRRAPPERGGAAGGDDRPARAHGRPVLAEDAGDAAVLEPQVGGAGRLEDLDARPRDERRRTAGARRAGRSRCRRRARCAGASGRPRGRARGCRSGRRRTRRRARCSARIISGASFVSTSAAERRTSAAAGALGVLEVQLRRVVDRERRGEPALRPVARGLRERRRADHGDARARVGGGQRRVQAGGAGADDRDVRVDPLGGAHARVPYPSVRPLILRHDVVAASRHRPAPRADRPHGGDRARARAPATGSATRCATRRPPTDALVDAVHAPGHRDAIAAACAARRRRARRRHRRLRRLLRGGAARAPAARRRSSTSCSAARRRSPPRCTARPGHHADAGAGDGLLPLQQRRGRRAARARRARPRARARSSTGTSTTATGRTTSSTPIRACCSCRSTSRRCIRGAAPRPTAAPAPGTGSRSTCRSPPGSGDAAYRALVEHVVVPAARAYAPQLVLVSAGFDAHADDPLAGCTVTEAGLRRDGRERAAAGGRARGAGRARARGRLRPGGARGLARRRRSRRSRATRATLPAEVGRRRTRSPTRRRRGSPPPDARGSVRRGAAGRGGRWPPLVGAVVVAAVVVAATSSWSSWSWSSWWPARSSRARSGPRAAASRRAAASSS